MTLTDGTVLSPALGIGAFVEKTLVAAGQCTKVDPAGAGDRRRAARLRRDGRPRRGDQHRRRQPRQTRSPCSAAAASATRRSPASALAGAADDRRRRHRRPQARVGEGLRRHPHRATRRPPIRSSTSSRSPAATAPTCASRPIGNPTVYRQAFEARDLAGTVVLVGVPRPDDDDRAAVHRGVRPRRRAEVVLVRRLPAVARLPDADRPLPPGPARPRPLRVSETIALDDVEEAFHKMEQRRGPPQRRRALSRRRADRARHHRRHLRARRRELGGHQQHLARRRRPRGRRVRRRPRPPADRRRRSTAAGSGRSCSPTATTTTSTPPCRCATPSTRRCWLHDADRMLWDVVWPDDAPDRDAVARRA